MIIVVTTGEEVHQVFSKAGKKAFKLDEIEKEYTEYTLGLDLEEKLSKDPSNLTKKGNVRKDIINKEMKKRNISYGEFLTEFKKFKPVDFIVYEI